MNDEHTPIPALTLHLALDAPAAADPTPRVRAVAAMFGLALQPDQRIPIVPPFRLTLHPNELVFITGPSGGGKSAILRLIEQAVQGAARGGTDKAGSVALSVANATAPTPLTSSADSACQSHPAARPPRVFRFHDADTHPARPVLDAFDDIAPHAPLDRITRWLALAGLGDALVMLRRVRELSDGQRHRLALARTIARVESGPQWGGCPTANEPRASASGPHVVAPRASASGPHVVAPRASASGLHTQNPRASANDPVPLPHGRGSFSIILADEFAAALDRVTAAGVARNVRKWTRRTPAPVCFIAATTHDDLLEPLDPDVLIEKDLNPPAVVLRRRRRGGGAEQQNRRAAEQQIGPAPL